MSDDARLPFFPPPEEWSAWLAEPAGTPYPWPEEDEGEDPNETTTHEPSLDRIGAELTEGVINP